MRELEALVFDAVVRHGSGILSMESFRAVIGDERLAARAGKPERTGDDDPLAAIFGRFPSVGEIEEYMIGEAMRLCAGNLGAAGKLLGMGRQTLTKRLKG